VVTVGSIQAGHAPNIINDKVLMKLTVRTLNEQVRETSCSAFTILPLPRRKALTPPPP
jgi:metal-dependent amidase/aminoacylase/carboxypeptidase family protein